MSVPQFVFIMANGDVWISSQFHETPTGTIAATYRVNGGSILTKLGTISGTSPNFAASGSTGKTGRELGGR